MIVDIKNIIEDIVQYRFNRYINYQPYSDNFYLLNRSWAYDKLDLFKWKETYESKYYNDQYFLELFKSIFSENLKIIYLRDSEKQYQTSIDVYLYEDDIFVHTKNLKSFIDAINYNIHYNFLEGLGIDFQYNKNYTKDLYNFIREKINFYLLKTNKKFDFTVNHEVHEIKTNFEVIINFPGQFGDNYTIRKRLQC